MFIGFTNEFFRVNLNEVDSKEKSHKVEFQRKSEVFETKFVQFLHKRYDIVLRRIVLTHLKIRVC